MATADARACQVMYTWHQNTRNESDFAEPFQEDAHMTTTAVDYGSEEQAMRDYLREGERRAFELGNRGPIRFDANDKLVRDILDAYWRCGFYVFEGVLQPDELADIEADVKDIMD